MESIVVKPVAAFPEGATFVFGSWVCVADGDGGFSRYLKPQPESKISPPKLQRQELEDLVENFGEFSTSDYNSNWGSQSESTSTTPPRPNRSNEPAPQPSFDSNSSLIRFPFGLRNAASVYQGLLTDKVSGSEPGSGLDYNSDSDEETPLTGPQPGLVITSTPAGRFVYWPGKKPEDLLEPDSRLIACLDPLPFQHGAPLAPIPEEATATEVISSSSSSYSPEREVFVAINEHTPDSPDRHHRRVPRELEVSDDELTADAPQPENEAQRERRRARNARRAERRRRLAEYVNTGFPVMNLDEAFDAVATRQHNTPFAAAASMDIILRAMPKDKYTALLTNLAERTCVLLDKENPINSVRGTHSQRGSSNQGQPSQQPHQSRGPRPPPPPAGANAGGAAGAGGNSHRTNSHVSDLRSKLTANRDAREIINSRRRNREHGDDIDGFPAFTSRVRKTSLPEKFKPPGITKYDGKQDPVQWLRCYSLSVQSAGGTNDTKLVYFPICMEAAPLTWLESLPKDSIDSWEDLKKAFTNNYAGAMQRPGNRIDLSQIKQKQNETLRDYIRRFFDKKATIVDITERDVIDCFQDGLFDRRTYTDFGRRRPSTVKELKEMVQTWADEEDRELAKFEASRGQGQTSHQNYSKNRNGPSGNNYQGGQNRKRKPDNTVAAMQRSAKNSNNQDRTPFIELLKKQCPWHPLSKHSALDCITLRKVLREAPGPSGTKDDQGNIKDAGDKDDDYQDPAKTVNVIFGGLPTKRAQKLTLREIMSIEPAVPTPLKWSEVPISFSRADQWTSFSNPGRYPLVLDPTVAGSRLTKVLIDGGSGLNVLFAATLKKMGLDIKDMLTPSSSPFYGIVPGNAAIPLGQVVLPVTFGTKENYRTEYINFEVADFETSYHAILGRPALAKFMAVPHYVYLVLKMPSPKGVLSLQGDLKRSYDCDIKAIEFASTSQAPSPLMQVLTASKKLAQEDLEIPEKSSSTTKVKPAKESDVKTIDLGTGDKSKTALIGAGLDPK